MRGKARRNTERFADEHGVAMITVETLYDAKAHFAPLTRHRIRVVVVTMDSHLAARGRARAERLLARDYPGLELAVHAADEWGSDDAALERCIADIARGDIIIATMLFLDDHVRAVLPALAARRDHCDAMICCMSAGEVVKLTRIGKFDMSGEALGAIALAEEAARQAQGGKRPAARAR